jgi:hypothetical protein
MSHAWAFARAAQITAAHEPTANQMGFWTLGLHGAWFGALLDYVSHVNVVETCYYYKTSNKIHPYENFEINYYYYTYKSIHL